jgi:DNA primase
MIPRETVDKIFDAAVIHEVVSDYVNLKKAGANYKGQCPFHDEKTPSFMVSPAKGIYKCFGCGASGNSAKFIMEHERVSFPEALRMLAKKYHIEIVEEYQSDEQVHEKEERDALYVVTEYAKNRFKKWLLDTDEGKSIALSYFKERGFHNDTISKFELGWSPSKRDALTEDALKNGYKLDFLEKTGLTIVKSDTGYNFDRFADRVIFPVHTLSGKVTAFGGRTLKTDKNLAKYLNSPESEIYHKSNLLYGLYFAKNAIVKKDKCFMVEGYTDVIQLHQAGIENVVASSGTSLTVEQIKLVRRFTKNLTVIYDGDAAGIKASLRGIDLILAEELNVKVVMLPEGEDPDSFARKHTSIELERFIEENETDFIKFKIKLFSDDSKSDPVKRAQLTRDIIKSIASIPDKILRAEYIRSVSSQLNVNESILYEEVRKILYKSYTDYKPSELDIREKLSKPVIHLPVETSGIFSEPNEKEIIHFLLNCGNKILAFDEEKGTDITVAEYIINEIKNESLEFKNLIYKEIFEEYEKYFTQNHESATEFFLKHQDEKIGSFVARITGPKKDLSKMWKERGDYSEMPEDRLNESVPEAIERFKLKIIQKKINEIDKQIGALYLVESTLDDDKKTELREIKNKLEDIKVKLTKFTEKSPLL